MPRKSDKIPINNKKLDRRVKLTEEQKEEIRQNTTDSIRELGRKYNVDKRTIQFIKDPQKLEECKKRRAERGGSKIYYDKEKNRETMKEHRDYKKDLYNKGLIGD